MSTNPTTPMGVTPRPPEIENSAFTDVVELPSKGIFYAHKKGEVVIELMTALDENILTSPNLIRNNTQFDVLLRQKIKDPDFNVDELLRGDKDTLLLFLRCTSYGTEFPVTVFDPFTSESFETTVDLSRITAKELDDEYQPEEDGMFSFTLPKSGKKVRFRLLTEKEETTLARTIDAKAKRMGGIAHTVTDRLKAQLVEFDGITERMRIALAVDRMLVKDSYELRLFMHEVEPGLDTNYEFVSPTTGETFHQQITFGIRLFYPSAKL